MIAETGMEHEHERKPVLTGDQIRVEQTESRKRSRASAQRVARPLNLVANVLHSTWMLLKLFTRP
jgi:hypothetical protein